MDDNEDESMAILRRNARQLAENVRLLDVKGVKLTVAVDGQKYLVLVDELDDDGNLRYPPPPPDPPAGGEPEP